MSMFSGFSSWPSFKSFSDALGKLPSPNQRAPMCGALAGPDWVLHNGVLVPPDYEIVGDYEYDYWYSLPQPRVRVQPFDLKNVVEAVDVVPSAASAAAGVLVGRASAKMLAPLFDPTLLARRPKEPEFPKEETPEIIYAWRAWDLAYFGKISMLTSIVIHHVWPAGKPFESNDETLTGYSGNGIHALKGRESARLEYADADAFGMVALWGRVIEHEYGYRAQYAYPQSIFLNLNSSGFTDMSPADVDEVRQGLRIAYGVDVT